MSRTDKLEGNGQASNSRSHKVAEELKREVSSIIHDEIHDPRLGFITVTRAEITKDLQIARIFFSVMGPEIEKNKTQKALESAKGFIRRLVGQRLKLRWTPELVFKLDNSVEYSIDISAKIDKLKAERVRCDGFC